MLFPSELSPIQKNKLKMPCGVVRSPIVLLVTWDFITTNILKHHCQYVTPYLMTIEDLYLYCADCFNMAPDAAKDEYRISYSHIALSVLFLLKPLPLPFP